MRTTIQQAPDSGGPISRNTSSAVPGREVIQNRVEIGPEAPYVWHMHPGEEIIYILEGTRQYDAATPPSERSSGPAVADVCG